MTYIPHKLGNDDVDGAILMHDFFEDCGGDPQFQLSCINEESKEAEVVPLEKPFLLVGRSSDCDLCFKHREVSYRHAYLQLLKERLLVVDLGSRTGTSWKGNRRRSGWLLPGREVQFGPHIIKLVRLNNSDDDYLKDGDSNLELKELIEEDLQDADTRPFPHATLELLSANSKSPTGKTLVLKPGVTLIGRSRVAQIRLKHDSVSHVHSSLVLTQNGLWLIDLLGRGGSYVNGEQVEFALLQRGDVLTVGAFHLRVETGHMKPLTGTARAQLKKSSQSNGDSSLLNGASSPHLSQSEISTQHISAIQPEESAVEEAAVEEAVVEEAVVEEAVVEEAVVEEAVVEEAVVEEAVVEEAVVEEAVVEEAVVEEATAENESTETKPVESGAVESASVHSENDQPDSEEEGSEDSSIIDGEDPSRWGEIIDALKSGGFGT